MLISAASGRAASAAGVLRASSPSWPRSNHARAPAQRLRLSVVKGFRKKEIERLAKGHLAPGSEIVSDGLSCWPAVEKAGCSHRPMATGSGKRAARWTPFRWVNTTLGNIKTAIAGTYHHISAKHAQSYLTSFAYRFNRRFQLDSIVERLAWAAVHTSPQPYHAVIADASNGQSGIVLAYRTDRRPIRTHGTPARSNCPCVERELAAGGLYSHLG